MIKIKLPLGEWEYNPQEPLGPPGGFGAVFAGQGGQVGNVAIKRLHLEANALAHRELRIATSFTQRPFNCVIPVFDAGQDAETDAYFIVMARAEKSLQQELDRVGSFGDRDTVTILSNIVAGLAEVPDIVHRDLKPGNVLWHEQKWKIADFGIARFVEDATSTNTLKECLSRLYAAPEQWRGEHATPATDIYALGCIAYALLTGNPPFSGLTREDYQAQHLYASPPPLAEEHLARLRSLIAIMLRKEPQGRPTLERVTRLLAQIMAEPTAAGSGFHALAQAGAADAQRAVVADAARMEERSRQEARKRLADEAIQSFNALLDILFDKIKLAAPTASHAENHRRIQRKIQLGSADLVVELLNHGQPIPHDAFPLSHWDIIVGAAIKVTQNEPRHYEWSANLWYTRLNPHDAYRWWEVCYMDFPGHPKHPYQPFATDDFAQVDKAAGPIISEIQFAAPPCTIDDEDVDSFSNRWASLLAKAYQGRLEIPSHLPLP